MNFLYIALRRRFALVFLVIASLLLLLLILAFVSGHSQPSGLSLRKYIKQSQIAENQLHDEFTNQYPECAAPSFARREIRTFDAEPLAPAPALDTLPLEEKKPIVTTIHQLSKVAPAKPYTLRWRIGIGIPEKKPLYFPWPETRPGWYLNWTTNAEPTDGFLGFGRGTKMALPNESAIGMSFTPMVRVRQGKLHPTPNILAELAAENKSRTWLIGNEPDVEWQDNTTAEEYAYAYRCAYTVIKENDPLAQIAIGGVSQITPLRLAYIDRIWTFYASEFGERMPVDVWNMHAFVLREEAGNWGVRIPPGFDNVTAGMLWEADDHSDIALIKEQIIRLRQWMADNGEQNKPLIISEYGILLPEVFGYPMHIVSEFMWNSFDLFADLRDPALGYPADDHRLVQRWVWFSSRYHLYESGNLYDNDANPTILTRALSAYIEQHAE